MARAQTVGATTLSSPPWVQDYLSRDHLVASPAKLDATAFPLEGYTITTSGAAQGATSIPVTALTVAIPNGTILNWTGAGEFSLLTAAAAVGATSLTVEALDVAIENTDTALYVPVGNKKAVRSGTVVGRTYAEAANGDPLGPAADTDDEVFLVVFDVDDLDDINDVELYRPGSMVKQNLLPQYTTMSATVLGKVRAAYICVNASTE